MWTPDQVSDNLVPSDDGEERVRVARVLQESA
jgi:hypothetical protein